MSQKKLNLTKWCDEQVAQGKELKIVWDGGNDSGWAHFQIDGEEYEDEHTEHLVEAAYDELDYGSWAGDYSASGEAIYNSEEKAFIGVDDYRESESYAQDTQISVVVPKNLWFDTLNISVEMASYEDSVDVRSQFRLKNGFLTDKHNVAAEQINKHLESEVDNVVESVSNVHEVDSVWENINIDYKDFKEKDENTLEYIIESIDVRIYESNERNIYVSVERLDKQLND